MLLTDLYHKLIIMYYINYKLENQYVCPYCHTNQQGTTKPVVRLDITEPESDLIADYHEALIDENYGVMYVQGYVKGRGEYGGAGYINYCPICGRKLRNK